MDCFVFLVFECTVSFTVDETIAAFRIMLKDQHCKNRNYFYCFAKMIKKIVKIAKTKSGRLLSPRLYRIYYIISVVSA